MPDKQIPLIYGPIVIAPGLAVLWHYADDPCHSEGRRDRWTCVGIFGEDEAKQAADESLIERPAMEPGHAVVMSLSALSLVRHDSVPSRCKRCDGTVINSQRHGEGFCVALRETLAPTGADLHGCWECGTSDFRDNVCAEHAENRSAPREQRVSPPANSPQTPAPKET